MMYWNITGDSVARVCQVPDDVDMPARVNQSSVAIIRPNPKRLCLINYLHYYYSDKSNYRCN